MTLEVTPERVSEILALLQEWRTKKETSRKELESLLGILHFVSSCVRQGRVFVSRLLNILRGLSDKGKTPIPLESQSDIAWWERFLPSYSGVSMMYIERWSKPDSVLASDACLEGCGAWSGKEVFHASFPRFIIRLNLHINALELLGIVVALKVWGYKLRGKRMLVKCDNQTSVAVVNSGRAKDKFLQDCLRELAYISAIGEFEIRAVHIPGVQNRIPDLLSRFSRKNIRKNFTS
jgi:hypothetical protein